MKCCREFYKHLYSEEPIDNNMVNKFLNDVNLPRLPTDIVEHCEGFLSLEEAKDDEKCYDSRFGWVASRIL